MCRKVNREFSFFSFKHVEDEKNPHNCVDGILSRDRGGPHTIMTEGGARRVLHIALLVSNGQHGACAVQRATDIKEEQIQLKSSLSVLDQSFAAVSARVLLHLFAVMADVGQFNCL